MNIKHIYNKIWYFETKFKGNTSKIYKLLIYRNLDYSYYRCRYQLVSSKNEGYQYNIILKTDSKEEMKMTLDLMGLRIDQVNIIIRKKSNKEIIIPYSVIELTKK